MVEIFFLIYVDDMLLACKDKSQIEKMKEILKSEFDVKDLGHAKKILGMEIIRDRANKFLYLNKKKLPRKGSQKVCYG